MLGEAREGDDDGDFEGELWLGALLGALDEGDLEGRDVGFLVGNDVVGWGNILMVTIWLSAQWPDLLQSNVTDPPELGTVGVYVAVLKMYVPAKAGAIVAPYGCVQSFEGPATVTSWLSKKKGAHFHRGQCHALNQE